MSICVLSQEEFGRLVNYGIKPSHVHHIHITESDALDGVALDNYFIPAQLEKSRAVVSRKVIRQWRKRPSEGFQVLQLVQV